MGADHSYQGTLGTLGRAVVFAVLVLISGGDAPAAPANDSRASATVIDGASFVLTGDLAGGTLEASEPVDPNLLGRTLWWRWTAPTNGVMAWSSAGSTNPVHVTVLEADPLAQWSVVASTYLRPQEGTGGGFFGPSWTPDPAGSFPARAAGRYWIRLDGVRSSIGGFVFPPPDPGTPYPVTVRFEPLSTPRPAMDDFAERGVLSLVDAEFGTTLAAATREPGEVLAHPAATGRTVWWEWTAPNRGTARVEVEGPSLAPLLAVYERATWDRLILVASSATEFGNECVRFWRARPRLQWDTEARVTYFIQADAFPEFDRTQAFRAALAFTPSPTNDQPETATGVSGLDWSVTASNDGATHTPGEPVMPGQSGASSIWFRWTVPSGGLMQITTNEPTRFAEPGVEVLPPPGTGTTSGFFETQTGPCDSEYLEFDPLPPFSPIFGVFRRLGRAGNMPLLGYQTHGTNEVWAEITQDEVYVQLDGPAGITGTAVVNGHLTPPPANDAFASRIVLPSASVRVTGRSVGATAEATETIPESIDLPLGRSRSPRRTVWWEWTAPAAGTWVMRVDVGAGDHCFLVFAGDGVSTSNLVAGTLGDPRFLTATAGQVFRIGVFGVSGVGSNLAFRLIPAPVPRLGPPTLGADFVGRYWLSFDRLASWDLPVVAETSSDLTHWNPVGIEGSPGTGAFRIELDPARPASFVRLRVGP